MITTRPATAMGDGSPRECHLCPEDITIGAPCALDSRGFECHPECLDPSARAARASAAPVSPSWLAAAVHAKDLGDRVADLLDEMRGKAIAPPTRPAGASAATSKADFGDSVADAYDRLYRGAVTP